MKPFLGKCGLTDLETVCVIRHPVDWLGSWYRYRARPAKIGSSNYTGDISFEEFVSAYCDDEHQTICKIGNPARFMGDGKDGFGVDHVFRYEQMPLLVAFFEDRLGTSLALEQRNVSPKMPLTLPDDLRRRLEDTHPAMFEIWENAAR
ncbi:MAG: gamma-glutamyl kinase [Pseudomonadota bacterium]